MTVSGARSWWIETAVTAEFLKYALVDLDELFAEKARRGIGATEAKTLRIHVRPSRHGYISLMAFGEGIPHQDMTNADILGHPTK